MEICGVLYLEEDDSVTKRSAYTYTIHAIFLFHPSCLIFFLLTSIHIISPNHLGPLSLMASSAFEVLPALEADMGDISSIFTVSFADDHILGPANGNVAPELLRAADLEFINELWRTRETFNAKFFKVVDLTTRSVYPEIISCLLCNLSFFSFIFYVYVQNTSDFGYERPVQGSSTTYMNFISKKL